MRKIYVLVALAIIGIGSWCTTMNAEDNVIDLVTIEYSNIHTGTTVTFDSSEIVDLVYVSSDINKSALYIHSWWFSALDNQTTYIFSTMPMVVDWWFINDTKGFVYQDNNTKQLYRISVDYSAIDVPPDPSINWMIEYDILTNSSNKLEILLNTTLNELNDTRKELQEAWDFYNQSKEEFDNNSALVITLGKELNDLNTEYNKTKTLWINATTNLSLYQTWYGTLGRDYDKLEEEHNALSGILPVYVFFAIIGTAMVVVFIFKRKKIFGHTEQSDIKTEIETGYGQDAKKWDKFSVSGIIGKVAKKLTPEQRRKEDVIPEIKPPESETNMQDIHKKIDGIKSENDAFRKSIVKDFRGVETSVDAIETRVDAIETKLETKTGK